MRKGMLMGGGVLVAGMAAALAREWPEVQRYMKIRKM
jgi:hypothetical protein